MAHAASRPDAIAVIGTLRKAASRRVLAGYGRFALPTERALGIAMHRLHAIAKRLGRRHDLVDALWASGIYEARLLVAFVADPAALTKAQMDRWCRDFDNWGVVDTLCFHLFDRSGHAWSRIAKWRTRQPEFERRAAFALLASLALHDKGSGDAPFRRALPWIASAATDPRNFVKKGVLWALRGIGGRSPDLHARALALAARLTAAKDVTARWIGHAAARELKKRAPRQPVG
jgi:3-methyladenine DNA glycosylase AlkD